MSGSSDLEAEKQWLGELGIRVDSGRLFVGRRGYPFPPGTRVDAQDQNPPMRRFVALLGLGAAGIPAMLLLNALTETEMSWIVGLPVLLVLGATFQLLTAATEYAVVLDYGDRTVRTFVSKDAQLVVRLVAVLRDFV